MKYKQVWRNWVILQEQVIYLSFFFDNIEAPNRSVIAKFPEVLNITSRLLNEETIEIKRLASRAIGNICYENGISFFVLLTL